MVAAVCGLSALAVFAAVDVPLQRQLWLKRLKMSRQEAKHEMKELEGNLEICSGTGHTINRVGKTALCRCGQSSKKPYCDGTHAKVGFKTE